MTRTARAAARIAATKPTVNAAAQFTTLHETGRGERSKLDVYLIDLDRITARS
jgi:hypothetical protein